MEQEKVIREIDEETDIRKIDEENRPKWKKSLSIILFLLFGIGTWLNLNGIWIQLPLLTRRLPEGWSLSPQLGMASNIANIGPLIITLIRHLIDQSSSYEVPSICVIFSVGIIVPLILSFTWSKQVFIFKRSRSVYLLVLGFFLALVNCTSSVTYLPFLNRFHSKWLNIYFAGESLSSLIPAILGLIQGVGKHAGCIPSPANSSILIAKSYPPRFSVEIFLIILSFIMFLSFLSFLFLWKIQPKDKERKLPAKEIIRGENVQDSLLTYDNDKITVETKTSNVEKFTLKQIINLSIIFWTSILLIGCIPSINSYSLNPYGASTFHYVIIICQCCYPLVSLISTLRPQLFAVSTIGIMLSTISGSFAFFYIFMTAFLSPCPPFIDQWIGKYIVALMWILVYLIFYYERIALGNYFNKTLGHRGLFWYGLLTQSGAFIGALFTFLLDHFGVFKERDFCTNYHCQKSFI